MSLPVEWLTEGLSPPWWADPARANVVEVPTMPLPPVPQGPKTAEEQAEDDRVLDALRRAEDRAAKMEAKIDALLERMEGRPCMAPKPPPVPESWTLEKPKKVRQP